jgi:hypothetical protein
LFRHDDHNQHALCTNRRLRDCRGFGAFLNPAHRPGGAGKHPTGADLDAAAADDEQQHPSAYNHRYCDYAGHFDHRHDGRLNGKDEAGGEAGQADSGRRARSGRPPVDNEADRACGGNPCSGCGGREGGTARCGTASPPADRSG